MSQVANHPAVQEIKDNIASRDIIKARLVMDHFPELLHTEQEKILHELAEAASEFAIPLLSYLMVKHEKSAADFPMLAEIILKKAERNPQVIINGLKGDDPEIFHYLKLVRQLNLQGAVPNLSKQMLRIEGKTAQATILSSLGPLENPEAVDAIAEFLYLDDFDLAAATATALGRIATPTALQRLAGFLGKNKRMDLLILDLFAEVQDDFSLNKLNEALQSQSAPVRNHARSWLAAIGDTSVPLLVGNLSGRDTDQQILSLNILQEIGDEGAALAIRALINAYPANPNVRFAAFEALADLSSRKGDYVLAGGLTDPDSNVRLAAAKAIDRNLDAKLVAGVGNMIEKPGDEAENIFKAIIDAQAGNLFIGLIASKEFQEFAGTYLGRDVHPDIRDFFVELLVNNNKSELADTILNLAQQPKKQLKGRVCAVDDSKMVLHIYRSIMTELGFEVVLFSQAQEALCWLQQEKPDVLCTDLNMPQITGIQLIREVRKKYSKVELPIVLVTTQNELHDNESAREAGVSEIMHKPFDAEMMSAVFSKIMDKV